MQGGRLVLAFVSLLFAACTAEWYTRDADREVSGVLDDFNHQALADRATRARMPDLVPPEPPRPEGAEEVLEEAEEKQAEAAVEKAVEAAIEPPLRLDLRTTLSIAVTSSRRYLDARETLYLQGLGFTFTEFLYGPQFDAAVSYVWGDGDGSSSTSSIGGSLGASWLLPTNGTLAVSGGLSKAWVRDDFGSNDDWSTNTSIALSQPLLRGAGYDLYRETLTQAERSMVYSVRNFELFREDFTIDITRQFFDLVGQKRKLAFRESDLTTAVFDEEKAIELFKVDRAVEKDVIQARRQRLQVESALVDARTDFARQVERFLIDLGLPPETSVELVEEEPLYEIVSFEPTSAVEIALENQLEVQTRRDQLEDSERQFRLARNDLLPDMDLTLAYNSGGNGRHPGTALPSTWTRGATVGLEIPIQTIDRRNAWRTQEIQIGQARRDWELFVDAVGSDIEDQIRQLANSEEQIEISTQSLADEERATELLEFRFEQGVVDARELTEARQSLIDSRNLLIDTKVQHLIQQLNLYKDLGLLFIGADGFWSVGAPAPEERR